MGELADEIERLRREMEERTALVQDALGAFVARVGRARDSAERLRSLLVRLEPYVDVSRLPEDLLGELREELGGVEGPEAPDEPRRG